VLGLQVLTKLDLTYFKCQIIRFTLTPSDGSGQERRNGQQLVLCQSAARCPVQRCRRQVSPVVYWCPSAWLQIHTAVHHSTSTKKSGIQIRQRHVNNFSHFTSQFISCWQRDFILSRRIQSTWDLVVVCRATLFLYHYQLPVLLHRN